MAGNPFGHLKKGALHRMMGIHPSMPIPVHELERVARNGSPLERKRAQFALNARKFKHPKKR